ncbi:MAG: thiolase family protein [Deltaproteobacteria bacterium]|nr:thiolase family protein [Deltaproteobacteria bacterium]
MSTDHPLSSRAAITGLGMTELGRVYGRSATDLAADAVLRALADAGLARSELDGLLINAGISQGVDLSLAQAVGLRDLALQTQMNGYGSSAGQMIGYATLAVAAGLARHVACVFADTPLAPGSRAGQAYGRARAGRRGVASIGPALGFAGPIPYYALHAQRHMDLYGTTQDQLGAVAVSSRAWARKNPLATMREPLDLAGYHASPWIVEPFHILDCCLVSNGAICVIVSAAEQARDLARPPVYVRGFAQAHQLEWDDTAPSLAQRSSAAAFSMAGCKAGDIRTAQIYDCYTFTVIATLEDYGFCKRGEGGAFAASGALGPGGALPTNTGGGMLSAYYMWGMTPVSEAVIQARGDGGERQVDRADLVAVSGNGGIFNYHATLVLSPAAS